MQIQKPTIADLTNMNHTHAASGATGGTIANITGNAATVSNATLTTALTVNGGAVTLTGNIAGSTLTLAAGSNSIPVKATAAEVDTGSDDAKFVTTAAISGSHNVPNEVPGTAGHILVSDGTDWKTSANTFPNASATSGKIIKSDGTNWLASTETYAAPGTSGNVMKSDGTNWTSGTITAAGGDFLGMQVFF